MAFLLKRRDGRDIAKKKRYCPVQNGTYGQPIRRKIVGNYEYIHCELSHCCGGAAADLVVRSAPGHCRYAFGVQKGIYLKFWVLRISYIYFCPFFFLHKAAHFQQQCFCLWMLYYSFLHFLFVTYLQISVNSQTRPPHLYSVTLT
jgi:hypothetical protein